MTQYDENLKTIYGKDETVLSEKDLDQIEDEHYAITQGFADCPNCKGECQLAGGDTECDGCKYCSL